MLLSALLEIKPGGGKMLDVGCAHGWFVETAMQEFDVLGIEPDHAVFKSTAARGLPIREGYFPDVLQANEKFDVIVFNDVIEHIQQIDGVLQSCHQRLNPGGVLVLNLPNSDGVFYRLSKLFGRLGKYDFFELLQLLNGSGFKTVKVGRLPTLSLNGLYTRISYTGEMSILARWAVYCGVALSLPILRVLPGDILYVIAEKK
jgi:SAM-dependent methyltransferase